MQLIRFQLKFLNKENIDLKNEIKKLKKEILNNKYMTENKNTYDEILFNLNNLNNRISDQFFETNYSDYILS